LHALIDRFHEASIQVYLDVVLNHMGGADEMERFQAVKVDPSNRNQDIEDPREIEGWTHFSFPGRAKANSDFEWHYYHFSGVDYDNLTGEKAIFRIIGENKGWNWAFRTNMAILTT
jgi:alpha-amylase